MGNPVCDSKERPSTENMKLNPLCETPAWRRDDRLSFWPFVILLKYNWDTWEKQFSLVEESQGNVCAMAGEGRMHVCHQAALSCSFESFQFINGEQSGDNNSQASQNAIFEMGA